MSEFSIPATDYMIVARQVLDVHEAGTPLEQLFIVVREGELELFTGPLGAT